MDLFLRTAAAAAAVSALECDADPMEREDDMVVKVDATDREDDMMEREDNMEEEEACDMLPRRRLMTCGSAPQ